MVVKNGKRLNCPKRIAHLQILRANVTFSKRKEMLTNNTVWVTEVSPAGKE
jgi:hypothetical protein